MSMSFPSVNAYLGYIMMETEPLLLSCQDGQFIGGLTSVGATQLASLAQGLEEL